jgi:hypothetical protein
MVWKDGRGCMQYYLAAWFYGHGFMEREATAGFERLKDVGRSKVFTKKEKILVRSQLEYFVGVQYS